MSTVEIVVVVVGALSLASLVMQVLLLLRKPPAMTGELADMSGVPAALAAVVSANERVERVLRDEIAKNREESTVASRHTREELTGHLTSTVTALNQLLTGASQASEQKQEKLREIVERHLVQMATDNAAKLDQVRLESQQAAHRLQDETGKRLDTIRKESADGVAKVRDEVTQALKAFDASVVGRIIELSAAQKTQLEQVTHGVTLLAEGNEKRFETLRTAVDERLKAIQDDSSKKLESLRSEATASSKQTREEVSGSLKAFNDSVLAQMTALVEMQRRGMGEFGAQLEKLAVSNEQKLGDLKGGIDVRLQTIQDESSKKLEAMRTETGAASKQTREEVSGSLKAFNDSVLVQVTALVDMQRRGMGEFGLQLEKLTASNQQKLDDQKTAIDVRLQAIQEDSSKKLEAMRSETGAASKQTREEVSTSLKAFNDSVLAQMTSLGELQHKVMADFAEKLEKLTTSNQLKLDELKGAVDLRLKGLQEDNAKQLEQMRATVDEKLQGTLEKRLGDSFKQVSERLEQVYKGLGEMQVLATGVGDLKKVLSNVKTRGTWGEVQLGALLEQVLSPAQYATNVSPKQNGERVEFAVRMPARGGDLDDIVWLPIDAKFPIEDYQRLAEAQEVGDLTAIDAASGLLDVRIKQCARDIADKYVSPPQTTDFGILFLPTEGLFAEVVRRPGLCELIQQKYRVVIAGPTTLWSILTSLQMGFRTLAIQKRSSEVWNLLAAVKSEWSKYGEVLDKVNKKLQEATNTMDQAAVRTRAIGRKLRAVEELPAADAEVVLGLDAGAAESADDALDALDA